MARPNRTRICNLDAHMGPDPANCQAARPGWWCSREPLHDGPCAAHPWNDDPRLEGKAIDWADLGFSESTDSEVRG